MSRLLFMTISLVLFWLLLSGFWDNPLLLSLGAVSVLLAVVIDRQAQKADPAHYPLGFLYRLPRYWFWLLGEIITSNFDVMKRILFPQRYPIDPQFAEIAYTQKSRVAIATFSNSITLTPGTVAISTSNTHILVHALTAEAALSLADGEMDWRVSALERGDK